MNWEESHLGEHFDIKHGYAFKGDYFSDSGKYIVVTPGNFYEEGGFKFIPEKAKYYSIEPPEDYILQEGDLIVAMTEQMEGLLGSPAFVPEGDRFLHNQRIGLIVNLNENTLDRRFLYFLFNTHSVRGQIRASATGTKVKHTAPRRILNVKVLLPDITKQREIGGILGAYDDLMANNERRIGLLAEAMHLLYREWFGRLRFPGWEETAVVDGVPDGWEKRPLGDLCEVIMGQSPESEFYNINGEGLPFHQGVKDFGDRFVVHQTYCTQMNRIAEPGDILFSVRAPVGRMNYTLDRIVIGRGLAAMRNRAGHQSFQFYQLKSHFFKEDMIGSGAIFAAVTKKQLLEFPMLTPADELIEQFEQLSIPADAQITNLHLQNQKLREARDALLPRLMSGRIEV